MEQRDEIKQWKVMGQVDVMVLLHGLTQLLAQERNKLPHGMEDQVRWYYNQFEVMLGFLTYTEQTVDAMDKILPYYELAEEIAELSYTTEDVVDTHYRRFKMANQDQQPFILKMDPAGKLKKDVQRMMERIGGLMSDGNIFQYDRTREEAVQALNQSLQRTTRGWVADPEADLLVDNTKGCKLLVDRLIYGRLWEEPQFIAITGGMDMINLVKKVYHDASVRGHFDCRVWVSVGEDNNKKNLLLSILKDIMVTIPKEMYNMEEWQLKREVSKQLIGVRYLIVLQEEDGFWSDWRVLIKDVLPENKKGNRIILATNCKRKATKFVDGPLDEFCEEISYDSDPLYARSRQCRLFHVLYPHDERYWKVISKKIFGEKECPEKLEHLGREIINRCTYWPSIIVLIACMLRLGEKTVSRWSNMKPPLKKWKLTADLTDILTICYHEMPQHLKSCFLYLTVFPKDTKILVKQLIRLWIAEGLIQWGVENTTTNTINKQSQSRSMEDVAEKDYLEGLIGLNFIQITKRRSDGGPKSCRIRPSEWTTYKDLLLRDRFSHFYPCPDWRVQPRRLSFVHRIYDSEYFVDCMIQRLSNIDDLDFNDLDSNKKPDIIKLRIESKIRSIFCRIRTLSCLNQDTKIFSEEAGELFFKNTQLLRVLNLEVGEVGKLPKAVEKLFHLRYLSLRPAKNIAAPKSIFNLWNLQTIDLRTTQFSELPNGIWKMQQLRHLFLSGDGPSRLPIPESEECSLPNLQTLSFISTDPDDGIHISKRAPNLRKLGLYDYECFCISEQQATFNLPHLQILKFAGQCNFEVPITLPDTITKISIVKKVHLQRNVIEMFGKLSNLQVLKLVQTSFDDGDLVFGECSFPQLQFLKFEASNIVTWRLEDRAIPNLHCLVISRCLQLTEPPPELWKVNTLQELDLSHASMTFAKKVDDYLKGNEGLKLVVTFPLSKSGA